MCGRYIFYDGKKQKIRSLMEAAEKKLDKPVFEQIAFNEVFPGNHAFVGISDGAGIYTHVLQWGFSSNHGLVINARSETAFTSRFFADCIPCAAIASAYYEWSNEHKKYAFVIGDDVLYLAGLARKEANGFHYVILTEDAPEPLKDIHDRQPVVFSYEDAKKWCTSRHPASLLGLSRQNRSFYKV